MSDVTKTDLAAVESRLSAALERIEHQMDNLASYQREANGKVASLATTVAVHEERLTDLKDSRGRIFTVIASLAVAVFSWILHKLHP